MSQEKNTISQLKKEKKELESALDKAVKSGAITKYSEDWYEMMSTIDDVALSIEESTNNISKAYVDMFDIVGEKYDAMLQGYEHTETMLDEYISQAEAKGHIVSKKYYEALVKNEKNNISTLKKEQSDLIKARDKAVESGAIKKGSLEWYNMCAEIDAVTQALEESTTQLIEFDNAMREIDWSVFDLIQERISGVTAEADFLIELMSNDKLFDDKGKMTNQGIATTALHAQNYNTHMYQADDYGSEVAKLDKQIKKDPYDQELINRRNELIELQRESILAAEDEKQAIVSLIEEGIEIELDALQELIDKKNEELESERDLYEYQKKVKEQTKEIADIEKQMSAYSGDDSEEAQAKIQELKLSLEEAEADLKETEYDKYISDQQALLDTLYLEYETILNQRLDNVDALLSQVIDAVNAAASGEGSAITAALGEGGAIATILGGALGNEGVIGTILGGAFGEAGEGGSFKSILSTLKTETKSVGTTLSTAMKNIWSVGEGNAKSVLTMYGQGFQNKQTTTNTTLSNIKVGIDKMVAALNKEATTKTSANKTSSSSKKDPTKNTTTKKTTTKTTTTKKTTTKKSSGGDGKAKIGDKVKFVSGKYYYDSYGTSPSGYYKRGDYVYITHINKSGSHPYHISTGSKLGKGDLGWLKLSQLSGYFTGKRKILNNEYAWTQEKGAEFIVRPSDGAILTPVAKNDSVLNAAASSNIWNMANSPAEFIKDNLGLGVSNIPNDSNVQNSYNQTIESIVFSMPNVKNYDEMLRAMQRDKDFEKLILSMSIDRIAGKSSLAKNKVLK